MKELRKISQEELRGILKLHKLWLESEGKEGVQADLSYCDLTNANLRDVKLTHADLRDADLRYADLRDADLSHADLRYADLSYCGLKYADLFYADLRYCDLTNANLRYCGLKYADLFYAKVDSMVGLGNVGDENRTVYYFYKEDRIICGSFDNTLEEFKKAVAKKYGEDYGSYAIAIEMFEKMKDKE